MPDTSKKRLDKIKKEAETIKGLTYWAFTDLMAMIEERDQIISNLKNETIEEKDKQIADLQDELKLYTEDGPWRKINAGV